MIYAKNFNGGLNRATIARDLCISGIGLHSGKNVNLELIPAEAGNGLVFRASGSQIGDITISPESVSSTEQAVTLGSFNGSQNGSQNGSPNWSVSTVEHLLAALAAAGITDLDLRIDAPELPILDGSSLPFFEEILAVGIRDLGVALEPIVVRSPTWVVQGDRYLVALPYDGFRVTYGIAYDHPLLQSQSITMDLNSESCFRELLSARTFGFVKDVESLKSRGLALGASTDNAVVFTDEGYLNDSLRYEDECVRHKILDLIGDLYLLGRPLKAHIIASRAGHGLDVALGKNILSSLQVDELEARRNASSLNAAHSAARISDAIR